VGVVVVTGTRLKTGYDEPTPVTMMTADQLQTRAPNSVGEALAQLPAFHGSSVTTNLGAVSASVAGAQALLNLRGLGSNRVLVLLDGERLPASNVNASVDVNVIPQALLSRVDVVTGGASASYGSEAVAGVVNFILNRRYEGVELNVNGGETTHSDAGNAHVTLTAGHAFDDGRLRLEGSLEYFYLQGIPLGSTGRGWYDNGSGFVTLPAGSPTTFGLIPNVRFSTMAYGGLITKLTNTSGKAVVVPGLSGMQFGAGGALSPFDAGTFTGTAFQSGGSGPQPQNGMTPTQNRESAFFHGEYDLTPDLTVFGELMYNRSFTNAVSAYSFEQTTKAFTIYADNPFIPAPVAALLKANNIASFGVGRYSSDLPPIVNRDTTTLARANLGVRGQLGPTWSFDASLAYGETEQDFRQWDTINRNLYAAGDAVTNPANGQIVCRSTLAGLDPGCVPINVLGLNTVTTAGALYVSGFDDGDTIDRLTAFDVNVRGDLGETFQLGAGPVSVAFGGAWRHERATRSVSPLSAIFTSCAGLRAGGCDAYNNVYGGYQSYNPGPLNGAVSVTEGYVEFGVPLLKDVAFARSLSLDLAGRVTDYSTSGITYTWKVGPTWQVTDDFRLRLTRSQDIRAPSINELFSTVASSATVTSVIFPSSSSPGPVATTSTQLTVGNPNLKPEVAQTFTVGGVYRPHFVPGLEGSIDYYDIDIEQAIGSVAAQTIVNGCAAGNQTYCALITVSGKPVTTTAGLNGAAGISIGIAPLNIASVKTSGLDAELSYAAPIHDGRLTLRAIGNYTLTFENSAAAAPNGPKLIGAYGIQGQPRWTLDFTQAYDHPLANDRSFMVQLEERLIAPGRYNPNYTPSQFPTSEQDIPEVTYVNLTAAYRFQAFGAKQEAYVTILNLFDKDPPSVPIPSTFQAPTRFDLYDILGRRFTLGIKARW
jgi:outer membrane receptor protein involved in Fe transport